MNGYTGQVVHGGPSDVRELAHLVIRKASVSEQDNNAYLLTCRASGEQLLVDAADDADRLRALVEEGTGWLDAVVTTHRHWDHHRALPDVVEHTGARVVAGDADADELPVPVDERVTHGDRISFGDVELEVIHLRGHTPGSVALLYRDPAGSAHLFTGDSLFPGGVGNTFGDAAAFRSLVDDVEQRIFAVLGDDTWFYPGHGADSTLGTERPHLAEWRTRGW
jgi:glyoxylase-like metal-dependent hydrolase (beta-lactamase superfamily II)